jgi:protein-tyrosine phosphatase
MVPLVDMHCHLLAGLDDGPRTPEDALEMCRIAHAEGTRMVAALAHQNERWCDVTPEIIRTAVTNLTATLQQAGLELAIFPTAEVTAHPDMDTLWDQGKLQSVADRKAYLLVEMPAQLCVNLAPTARELKQRGVRIILAHPERQPELLHENGAIEALIQADCLVQVSSASVTDPKSAADRKALKSWFRRGCVHVMGSDGHSPRKRQPLMAAAYREICDWIGGAAADRVCGSNGATILRGQALWVAPPEKERRRWFQFW